MMYRIGLYLMVLLGLIGGWCGSIGAVTAQWVLSDTHPQPGEQVTAELQMDMRDTQARLGAYAVSLNWNKSVVQLATVQDGTTAHFGDPQRLIKEGELRLSQFSATGSDSVVSLARLVFDVVGQVGDTTGWTLGFDVLDAANTFESLLQTVGVQTSTLVVSAVPSAAAPSITGTVRLSSTLPQVDGQLNAEVLLNVSGAERLSAYAGRLVWEPGVLQLIAISDGETAAFANGQIGTESGAIAFSNLNAQGETGAVSLLKVTFDVVGLAGQTGGLTLTFQTLSAAGSSEDLLPYLNVQNATYAVSPGSVSGGQGADFDGSGEVDFVDFLFFAQHFGARLGELEFVSAVDLDSNGAIDFSDFLVFAQAFGQSGD